MEHNGYKIALDAQRNAYAIHTIGKGSLPKVLSGLFSTPGLAKIEINAYIKKSKKKEG